MMAQTFITLTRQALHFGWTGIVAAIVHYGILIGLVERAGAAPVPAALAGYVCGGIVSYALNRRWTFAATSPHLETAPRFALVAFIGFCLTGASMSALVDFGHAPYLPAQIATTLLVISWSFLAHRSWTFRATQQTSSVPDCSQDSVSRAARKNRF